MRFFFNGSESLTQTPSFGWSLVEGWVNYIEPRKQDSNGDLQWGTALGPQTWFDSWYLKLYGDPSLRFHNVPYNFSHTKTLSLKKPSVVAGFPG